MNTSGWRAKVKRRRTCFAERDICGGKGGVGLFLLTRQNAGLPFTRKSRGNSYLRLDSKALRWLDTRYAWIASMSLSLSRSEKPGMPAAVSSPPSTIWRNRSWTPAGILVRSGYAEIFPGTAPWQFSEPQNCLKSREPLPTVSGLVSMYA